MEGWHTPSLVVKRSGLPIMASFLTLFFLAMFLLVNFYETRAVHGLFVDEVYIGEKTKAEIADLFKARNELLGENIFIFAHNDLEIRTPASALNARINIEKIWQKRIGGKQEKNFFAKLFTIIRSYFKETRMETPYKFDTPLLNEIISPIQRVVFREATNAEFVVKENRVVVFKNSKNGQTIDFEKLTEEISKKLQEAAQNESPGQFVFKIPIKILSPEIKNEDSNNLGVVEVIGTGQSLFKNSIPNRIFNLTLASEKLNGILVAPDEVFSFNKHLGDVSKFTGYKEAYIIKKGRTILGDGGGVCQVSTTLFRAALDAGIPIIERYPHSYRVSYYEQNSPPGIDATVFSPWVDLKFKNDTGNYILIQGEVNPKDFSLTFTLWGKKDGREVTLTKPVITNEKEPFRPPLFEDDPTLPLGEIRQVEREARGATVTFKRIITRNDEIIRTDTFRSVYLPWRAVFLRGTKEL